MKIEDLAVNIEDLARMVQGEFSEVRKEFKAELGMFREEVLDRFRGLENKFDSLQIELLDIKKKLDNIVYRHEFEFVRDKVEKLEQKLSKLTSKK